MQETLKRIGDLRIVPVVSIDDAEDATALGDALVAGGLPIAEITFRTEAAIDSIRTLARRRDMLVGAGTVLNVDTARRAVDAGATFIVSPGFNPKTVRWCVDHRVPITPGVATPSDIEAALEFGLNVVKFFPAEALGGIPMLKAIAAPYAMMYFTPTGGISMANLDEYLKFPTVLAVGGTWMVTRELISDHAFRKITDLTKQAVTAAAKWRPNFP